MSEQPSWTRIERWASRYAPGTESAAMAGLVRDDEEGEYVFYADHLAAVEKALAEQREEIGKLIASDNEAWTRRLAEQEARHKREVLEVKIGMLDQWAYCPHEPDSGDCCSSLEEANERQCAGCATYYELEAELAALEVKP